MTLLDVGNCVVVSPLHSPAVFSADRDGSAVDTAKYAYAFIVVNVGVIVGGQEVEFYLEQALTSGGAWTQVQQLGLNADGTYNNAVLDPIVPADNNTVKIVSIDLNNTQRFLRLRADHSAGGGHLYGVTMVMMPYQTDTVSDDASAASAPLFNV